MKASRILAGLSAVSIAASMLSMVAASADDEKLTVDEGAATDYFNFEDDGDFTETDGVDTVDATGETDTAASADYKGIFGSYSWYGSFTPKANKFGFGGWPGWGLSEFPDGWAWFLGIKTTKDITWETFGTKDLDKAAPGYLVFEFENGKKWLVPASVDENGQYVTDEAYIPYMNVSKIYFLYEVTESPYFKLDVDKFTVNGKDVELNKDNWKNEVKYIKTTSTGEVYLLDHTNNSIDALERDVLASALKFAVSLISEADKKDIENKYKIKLSDEYIDEEVDKLSDDDVKQLQDEFLDKFGIDLNLCWAYDEDDNLIVNGIEEDAPIYYQATIFDKNAQSNSVINHALVLWGTKVTVTFTVDGIGKVPVHGGVFNDKGDNKGDVHTHVDPDEAGGLGTQKQNIDKYPVNPKFNPSDTCSEDLYDQLVDVYNSDPTHMTDAEITFKTVADKGGILVANFINVWELDKDKDGTTRHWIKEFEDGYAVYVKQDDVVVGFEKQTVKCYKLLNGQPILKYDANGNPIGYEEEDIEVVFDGKNTYWPVNKEGIPEEKVTERKELKEKHWIFDSALKYDVATKTYSKDDRFGKPVAENGKDALEPLTTGEFAGTYHDLKFLADDKQEEAYCWHPYFLTENGLVDVVTKDYLGNSKTNAPDYYALTDSQIKYLQDNNGMYYNDNLHHAAYGHFVVFGDNTERQYSYRIKAEAVKSILDTVQRAAVQRNEYVYRHGAVDIVAWHLGSDGVIFNGYNKLIMPQDEREDGFTKDYEAEHWLDSQIALMNKDGENKDTTYPHARATHGAVWLQCCEGTYIRDVKVHAHTTILLENEVPKSLYNKDNYEALYPTKPAESAASAAAAQPTAAAAAADENAGSGAAAGFGIAGLLLAGAAMVCAKKKER